MIVWERIQTIVTLSGQWPTRQKDGSHVRTVHRRNKCKYQLSIKDGKRNCSIHWIVIYPVNIEPPQPDQQLNFTLRQLTVLHVALYSTHSDNLFLNILPSVPRYSLGLKFDKIKHFKVFHHQFIILQGFLSLSHCEMGHNCYIFNQLFLNLYLLLSLHKSPDS